MSAFMKLPTERRQVRGKLLRISKQSKGLERDGGGVVFLGLVIRGGPSEEVTHEKI